MWVWNLGNIPEGAGEGSPEGSGQECTGRVRPAGLVRGEPASASGVARPAWDGLGAAGVPAPSCALGSGCMVMPWPQMEREMKMEEEGLWCWVGGCPMRAPESRSSDPRWGKPGAAFREQQRAHLPSRFAGAWANECRVPGSADVPGDRGDLVAVTGHRAPRGHTWPQAHGRGGEGLPRCPAGKGSKCWWTHRGQI